jgi:hypothetical protein
MPGQKKGGNVSKSSLDIIIYLDSIYQKLEKISLCVPDLEE